MPHSSKEKGQSYRERNRVRINAQRRARYALSKTATLAQNKAYRTRNKSRINARRRVRQYGTDGADLLKQQDGLCGICGVALTLDYRRVTSAHLDHDHIDGHVRGWLCSRCNTGLGHFHDDAAFLEAAIEYLART